MESHVLNTYHQARYRIHGHNRIISTSESYSSESSCNQNSPEYPEKFAPQAMKYEEVEYGEWDNNQEEGDTVTNVLLNAEAESSESSSDDEDAHERSHANEDLTSNNDPNAYTEDNIEYYDDQEITAADSDDDYEIVVDDDDGHSEGPIIQVYAVDPDLDLEVSDEEQDHCTADKEFSDDEGENVEEVSIPYSDNSENKDSIENSSEEQNQDGLEININGQVVSNVDEYFIKQNKFDEKILEVKDQPVVADVDDYFIKDHKLNNSDIENVGMVPNVNDFFVKNNTTEKESNNLSIIGDVPNVDDFFNKFESKSKTFKEINSQPETVTATNDTGILPHIEHIKRFLLEDMPCPKLHSTKPVQRSCSLPHSPAHFSYLDVDDARTSLSFEDLNLDLSDFTFDDVKVEKTFVLPGGSSAMKNDDVPQTLTEEDVNSFLIQRKPVETENIPEINTHDDLSQEDMEIEYPVESKIACPDNETKINVGAMIISNPAPATARVLDFCIEKPEMKSKITSNRDIKVEADDFVDVESLNDPVIPVIEATNVSSLFEQFEASEKINTNVRKKPPVKIDLGVKVSNGLANGVRLQDAAVHLNKNKMRHLMMTSPTSNTVKKTSQTIHSDHDYCSPTKRQSLSTPLKGGQSLLKPEVLSSNNKILSSRHRSCKNKKVIYHLSSDDETENSSSAKCKLKVKPSVKTPSLSNHRKKLSPKPSVTNITCKETSKNSVISNNASEASDNCSQSSSGSIKLTIKNKSKVILKIDCDDKKDSQKIIDKSEIINPIVVKKVNKTVIEKQNIYKSVSPIDSTVNKIEADSIGTNVSTNVAIKEEARPEKENFYTALFQNKRDIQIMLPEPVVVDKCEIKPLDIIVKKEITDNDLCNSDKEIKPQKKKLNLQEYKLRREGVSSNGNSRTVSPEAIFQDIHGKFDKAVNVDKTIVLPNNDKQTVEMKTEMEASKKIFDPIREASRKILMNTKKQKAAATRKRDEDIVMSKIPKVENLELQPLISEAEMMKIVGMTSDKILPITTSCEKPKCNADYDEIVLVSVGTNTDDAIFKQMMQAMQLEKYIKRKSPTPDKALINFKIKKSDNILKQNVFESSKKKTSCPSDNKVEKSLPPSYNKDHRINKERYKDITATLKSVGKQVDSKMSSNSLFASIQDVVMKKAPEDAVGKCLLKNGDDMKTKALFDKNTTNFRVNTIKTTIVRNYDTKIEHGEDKIILHLERNRIKPMSSNVVIQTEPNDELFNLLVKTVETNENRQSTNNIRKRTVSDISFNSEASHKSGDRDKKEKSGKHSTEKTKSYDHGTENIEPKELRPRSRDRYESKYRRRTRSRSRRSRSRSRRQRKRSRCHSRSRSIGRYRRYKRYESPYRRIRRSRSPYRRPQSIRNIRVNRRDNRKGTPSRTRSRSQNNTHKSRSPIIKKIKTTPEKEGNMGKKCDKLMTPPLRKPTMSESSDSSTSSSSSSSSSGSEHTSSTSSLKSQRSVSPAYKPMPYSSETRDCNTPVEERRIVFVGKLEPDIGKAALKSLFSKFGPILEVTLHCKDDGCRYGFVTFQRARDAWSAVESASSFPQYDVGFGGRRAFCRRRYADLDGLEAEYTESAYHGQTAAAPTMRTDDMSFEQMLLEMKNKLNQRKNEKKRQEEAA